jgi:endonuclease YncB( thermonuclease family)
MRKIILQICIMLSLSVTLVANEASAGSRSSSGYRSYKGAKAIDGDTYRYRGQRYRLRNYNAPEPGQRGAGTATRSLQRKLDSGRQYKTITKDAYGRPLVEER